MDESETDYGSWLIEDLRELRKELIADRDHSESYSDRVELNGQIKKVMAEIILRGKNDEC